jgi:hypothetical protein
VGQGDANQEIKVSYLLGIAPKLSAGDFPVYFPVLKYMNSNSLRN